MVEEDIELKTFDFDTWVLNNDLTQIKDVLIKHNLDNITNLSTQSIAFATFISDPILYQSHAHLIAKIITSIQQLATNEITPGQAYVVISETEENILKALQTNLDQLDDKEIYTQNINKKYKQSIQDVQTCKTEKINTVENKIKSYFEKVVNQLNNKKQQLLTEVDTFDIDNPISVDEQKETQILSESKTLIKQARNHLCQTLSECNDIIQSSINMDRDDRKKKIININNSALMEYVQIQNTLTSNAKIVETSIEQNNNTSFDINFMIDNMNQISDIIDTLKLTTSIVSEGCENKINDECIIKRQQNEILSLKSTIKSLHSQYASDQLIISEQAKRIKLYENELKQQKICECNHSKVMPINIEFPFKGDANKAHYFKCAKQNDFSCLMNYSKKYAMSKPEFTGRQISGGKWKMSMLFGGVIIEHVASNRRDARIKCITEFIDIFV
eukprot:538875_1